ncbi:MAG: hypothetical protein C0621_05605 [Desulfuromonas sp.]|nr:MAG: hypothetical protein C0621_05605 [Desulfuromonas sp.]
MEKVLIFTLGDERYGLEVAHIQEIVESPPLFYIPRAPGHYRGALNFHGTILPVLDLPLYLGFSQAECGERVVVLPPSLGTLALAVTAIERIVPFESDSLLPVPQERLGHGYIRAALEREGDVINMLDIERLLTTLDQA